MLFQQHVQGGAYEIVLRDFLVIFTVQFELKIFERFEFLQREEIRCFIERLVVEIEKRGTSYRRFG
jgi:hypothetical protein